MSETYVLMNKDHAVLAFSADAALDSFRTLDVIDPQGLPLGFSDMHDFLEHRRAPKHRAHIERLLRLYQCETLYGFMNMTHALSLNDMFWCKPTESSLSWRDVSLFTNEFDEVVARTAFEGGLWGEPFSATSPEFGTDGSFAKCWTRHAGTIYLLKTGRRGEHEQCLEPYSEVLAYQVARALHLDAVEYKLTWRFDRKLAKNMPATLCPLFTSEDIGFVPIGRYLGASSPSLDRLCETYDALGSGDAFRRMVVFDALVLNPDRHTGNHGILIDNETRAPLRMAPVFDNNLALCPGLSNVASDDVAWMRTTLRPRIGGDFNVVAHALMTPAIRRDLMDLCDFSFDRTQVEGMESRRIDALESLVRKQVHDVLKGNPFNVAPKIDESPTYWQLEDWPEEPLGD